MAQINLKGMGVALITPFKEDCSIDYNALGKLLEFQLQNGTYYLVIFGTTAETPTLSVEEKEEIKRVLVERVTGRITILLVLFGNNKMDIVTHIKKANLQGVDTHPSVILFIINTHK